MSTLSQFFGGGIKSIQRGSTTTTGSSDTVTISSVDTTKSVVIATDRSGQSLNGSAGLSPSASGVLTDATTLTVHRGYVVNSVVNPTLDWQVIEFI